MHWKILVLSILMVLIIPESAMAQSLGIIASASSTSIDMGDTVQFNSQVTGGVPPYSYCWDFGYRENDASLGSWNNNAKLICYSTSQNPSTIFRDYGKYEVWLYVEDSTGSSERAQITVNVDVHGTVINPTTDCGSNNLAGDGATDNGVKLANCINGKSGNLIVRFTAGNYRFKSVQNINGVNGGTAAVQFEPESGAGVTLTFDPDGTFTDDGITFFDSENVILYFKNLDFQYDLRGQDQKDRRRTHVVRTKSNAHAYFFENTIRDFTTPFEHLSGMVVKTNALDWGSGSYCAGGAPYRISLTAGAGAYDFGNLYFRKLYSPTSSCHEHWIYTADNQNDEYLYVVDNWIDMSNKIGTAYTINWMSDHTKLIHNYFTKATVGTVFGGNDIEIVGNHFYDTGAQRPVSTNGFDGFKFNYNIMDGFPYGPEITRLTTNTIRSSEAIGNVFGSNTPGTSTAYWAFYSPDILPGCNNQLLNPGDCGDSPGWFVATGNVDDETSAYIPDPGEWEFNPPTVNSFAINSGAASTSSQAVTLSMSVQDSGSGMGSSPRWPYIQGALMQFSNDGVNWHQVEPYATSQTWSLSAGDGVKTVYARFRDVDGNWASASDSITLSSGGPQSCPDGTCDPGETCSTCPQDCLPAGQVCCSGIAYTGNCCSDQDCPSSQTCSSHACTASGQPPAYGVKEYWSQGVPLNLMNTPPEEGHLTVQIPDDPAQARAAQVLVLGYDLDAPLGQEGHYFVNVHGPVVLVGMDSCNNMDCWLNLTIDKAWLVQGDNDLHFVHNATAGYNILGLGVRLESSHRADASGDGCIDMTELMAFIALWYQDSIAYPITEMMEAVGLWKAGAGCS